MNNMNTKKLKEMAKELKVKNWWTLKKAELIAAIEAAQKEDYTIAAENSNGEITIIAECHHEDIAQEAQNDTESAEEVTNEEVIVEEDEAIQDEPETKEKKPRGKMIEFNGKSQTLNKWAEELGFTPQTLFARLYISHWTVEKAFTTPSRRKTKSEDEEA